MANEKEITMGIARYKKLERIEERYNLLLDTWGRFMDAHERHMVLPEEMSKQKYPRLSLHELAQLMKSEQCKGMFPDEVLVDIEKAGK